MTAIGVTANGHRWRLSPMARRFARFSAGCRTSQPFWASSGSRPPSICRTASAENACMSLATSYVGVFDFIYFALLDTKMLTLFALCFTSTHRTVQRRIDKY